MIGVSEIFMIFFFIPFLLLGIGLFVFWLWTLIDCLKRPDDKFAIGGDNAKLIWVLVLIFVGFIGSLIYYFLIKSKDANN